MDSLLEDSVFDVTGASSDFEPAEPKAKAKPAAKPKKAAAAPKAATKAAATKAAPKPKKAAAAAAKPAKAKAASKKRAKADSDDENMDDSIDRASARDDSLLSVTPPSAKKQKKGPVAKAAGQPLADLQNEALAEGSSEKYQRLTQLEHIIKRPDTYIGSVERNEKQMWVFNSEKESMEFREINYVPGIYKIFDEILVNAADNKQNDKNMDTIKVNIDREKGEISVYNNGRGIPIEIHKKEGMYIPEMIFGHLLTSSNYDDEKQKVTGGRNGYGAKLCNVFSTSFTLETADSRTKQVYKQTWTDNMTKMGAAKITAQKGDDFTKVTFRPDFSKFKMDGIDESLDALMKRRVYDMAGTIRGVKVYLNGTRIKIKGFKEYMEMYTKAIKTERGEEAANDTSGIITDGDKNRWEIGFAVSDGSFQQVSFANSIATTSGGTHVNYIADQICNKLIDHVKKKNKGGAALKPGQIRNHIFVFVNAQIVNPAFTSQTKEQLTTKASQFGSKFECSDDFLKKIINKTEVVTNILSFAQQKADQILKKTDGSKRSRMDNPKLTDANRAGTKDGYQCTLILTEGDSAKGLAMTGRSIVGPDLFGVFPLRGKLLNVRDASLDQISKNAEIQNIKNILGLKHKQVYEDCKSLRYGHIMIMTDQDHDGSHIKGLLINFLQVQYPSLLKIPQFLIEFITPIVKVWKGDPKKPTKSQTFFTMPEYEAWKEVHAHERTWENKYFKGLGTSSDEDAEKYFRDLDKHLKEFHAMQDSEPELIELAFSKKKADERKEWLRQFRPGTYLDHSTKLITYTDFVNKELILFSMADNMRSIPSVIDGFKPGQRKVLFACMKRNIKKDIKVVELAGYVMGITSYHHGEASLQQTIVGLAQTFVGSNNINCLEPSGNFGSRLQGGSDSASARYIFTRLSPFARRVFHPLDEPLLKSNTDEDKIIEPEMYVPVVPMILINGADGIGTGWSSSIPNYNPQDIVDNLKAMMRGEEPKTMSPWFRDFEGTVEQSAPDRFEFTGKIKQVSDHEVEISELPIRVWTQDYKDKIVDIIKGEKSEPWIKDYDDYNTKQKVRFVLRLDGKHMKAALEEGLENKFKLKKTMATSNLVAFDAQGRITKYANVEEILKAFYEVRIKFYEKRKAYQLNEWNKDLDKLSNQARFIKEIIDGKLRVAKKKKADLVVELRQKGFTPYPKVLDATKDGELEPALEDETGDNDVDTGANAYDYLLGMAIWSLTKERVDKLLKQIADKQDDIDELIKLSKEDLWCKDLDQFMEEWNFQLQDEKMRRKKMRDQVVRGSAKLKTQSMKAAKKRKNADSDDSDFGVKKAKKGESSRGGILSHLKPIVTKPKAAITSTGLSSSQPKAAAPKIGGVEPAAKKAAATVDLSFDGASDSDAFLGIAKEMSSKAAPAASKKKAATSSGTATATTKTTSVPTKGAQLPSSDVEEQDNSTPARAARGRAAARKAVKYALDTSDSDDDESDGDFDVSKMVKGIGETNGGSSNTAAAAPLSRPLFSNSASMSRPGSSAGLAAAAAAAARKSVGGKSAVVEDADETDYAALVAAPSASTAAATTGANGKLLGGAGRKTMKKGGLLDDDDDDEDDFNANLDDSMEIDVAPLVTTTTSSTAATKKVRGRPAATTAASKEKKSSAAAAAPPAKAKATKAKAVAPASSKPKATATAAAAAAVGKKGKKAAVADRLVDEILSDANDDDDDEQDDEEDEDEDEDEEAVQVKKRPARRAVAQTQAKKKAWMVDSDEDEDEDDDEESDDEIGGAGDSDDSD